MRNRPLAELEKLVSSPGPFKTRYLMLENMPLDLLRDDPRFQEIVKKQKQIYEENLAKYGDL